MSWIRRTLGMDGFDLFLHAAVTAMVMAIFEVGHAPNEAFPMTILASLVLLGVRRKFALRHRPPGLTTGEMAAERIAELEQRVAELEAGQAQLVELQERLDFAERLLAAGVPRAAVGQLGPAEPVR